MEPLPISQNPFLQAREHARAKEEIELRYQQAQQQQRNKKAEYHHDLNQLVEHPTKQRDLWHERIQSIQIEQEKLEKERLEALDKYRLYKDAAEAGKGVFRDKWSDDDVYGVWSPVEAPPVIPDYSQLPTSHRVGRKD